MTPTVYLVRHDREAFRDRGLLAQSHEEGFRVMFLTALITMCLIQMLLRVTLQWQSVTIPVTYATRGVSGAMRIRTRRGSQTGWVSGAGESTRVLSRCVPGRRVPMAPPSLPVPPPCSPRPHCSWHRQRRRRSHTPNTPACRAWCRSRARRVQHGATRQSAAPSDHRAEAGSDRIPRSAPRATGSQYPWTAVRARRAPRVPRARQAAEDRQVLRSHT
jgi:hypothetical protein